MRAAIANSSFCNRFRRATTKNCRPAPLPI
jgi:hypothetical protein